MLREMATVAAYVTDKLGDLNVEMSIAEYNNSIDIDFPGRDVVPIVMSKLALGKWEKSDRGASAGTLNYTAAFPDVETKVRLYSAPPPPSCKIVETEELVPETLVPAYTRKIRKVVCSEPTS